jgi:hypothetical protein
VTVGGAWRYDPDWQDWLEEQKALRAGGTPMTVERDPTPPVSGTHSPSRDRSDPYPYHLGWLRDDPAKDFS